jgi:alpha-amylase
VAPLRFLLGFHLHQPVGNFDHVFAEHLELVYGPLLDTLIERDGFPVTFHVSGPLVEWLERHAPAWLERLGVLVADGRIELLAAGWTEPILAALLREDRVEQVERMRTELRRRFGVEARGLWLTERVWSPELPGDLARAGITHVLVDDRHFLAAGIARGALHRPFTTESDNCRVSVFAIDEHLRYLVPFQPPSATADYLRQLHAAGQPLAILADDGEKFGGWPGTFEWVYTKGWFRNFFEEMDRLRHEGVVAFGTFDSARKETVSGGLVYLPTASYREMEGWSLPAPAASRLTALERQLGDAWLASESGALVRGSHWRNFLVKYPESNRMHKKAQHLSVLARQRGNPEPARQAIARAQCNDAYWHGVFGGLYLPHLREAIWRELATAESTLRHAEPVTAECIDFDFDGRDELWVHGSAFSALVSPVRGGAVEELTRFGSGRNLCDVLTRREEAYHALDLSHAESGSDSALPSIHDLEQRLQPDEKPPVDLDERTMLRERVLDPATTREEYVAARYAPWISWTGTAFEWSVETTPEGLVIGLRSDDAPLDLVKRLTLADDGALRAEYEWSAPPGEGIFTVELTLSAEVPVEHDADDEWRHPVETVAKSERGLDRTRQGTGILLRWPASRGSASLRIGTVDR